MGCGITEFMKKDEALKARNSRTGGKPAGERTFLKPQMDKDTRGWEGGSLNWLKEMRH